MAITDQVEAKIQKRVGEFLTLKSEIIRLKSSSDPAIREEANQLYEDQIKAEGQLREALAAIEEFKTGGYSFSALSVATSGAIAIEKQIKAVKALKTKALGSTASAGVTSYWKYALVGVGVWWIYKKIF